MLLENLGRHFGAAIENMRLAALDQQMAVAQERNILAQNLHDSIAQTLSFVNLQVQMLEGALKDQNSEQIDDGIKQIKAGVQECYDDVRELLLNSEHVFIKRNWVNLFKVCCNVLSDRRM